MVDQEVEDILAEIRQRIIAAEVAAPNSRALANETSPRADSIPPDSRNDYASLAVLARTWNRLPPLVSNRTGLSAKLELWIKARMKTAFRWFTWEQVNFNAATHQTFLDLIDSLALQRQQLQNHSDALKERLESIQDELEAEIRTRRELNERLEALNGRLEAFANDYSTAIEERAKAQELEAQSRFEELVKEFRERDERLLDEQRVCFKQLSLELSESQVLQDRARRELDSRVAKLEGK